MIFSRRRTWAFALGALASCGRGPAFADPTGGAFDGARSGEPEAQAPAVPGIGQGARQDPRLWLAVRAGDRETRTRAAQLGLDIQEIHGDVAAGIASRRDADRLREAGFPILTQIGIQDYRKSFPPPDRAFRDYSGVQAELASIAAASKGLASLVTVGRSFQGREISAIRFNSGAWGAELSGKPGAAFFGTHHAREHLSTEIPLLFARWLSDHREDPSVRRLLQTRDIYIVPLVNPDGSEYDVATGEYQWQRKNMRPNPDGSFGADLNRNYDSHWCESGSSREPSSETFCGAGPFSEPESQAVRDFILARPNLRTMASFHSYDELILYPWSWGPERISDGEALKAFEAMARRMARWTGYGFEQSADLYSSSGDTCDWAWAERKIFCFTFELTPKTMSEGGFYPGPGAIAPTFQRNLQAMLYLADLADDPLRAAGRAAAADLRLPRLLPAPGAARAR